MSSGNWRAMFDSSLRFSARMTVSALATFAVVQVVRVPLHGLWAVLTAVILTQASVGGSIRATVEYVLGTIAGAVYASLLSLLLPHDTPLTTGAVLGLSIAPLAYAAARNAAFRAAPFTAIIVLLLAGQFDQSPIAAALSRLLEVALGGAIAILVSLLVFPELAQDRGRDMALAALERLAHALPVLLAALSTKTDPAEARRMQERIGALVTSLGAAAEEARHEPAWLLATQAKTGPLARTLRRLRHDLIIIGRAATNPLPDTLARRLAPSLEGVGSAMREYLTGCANALEARRSPPPPAGVQTAIEAYASEISAMRSEGLTRALAIPEVEQLFAVGFAFEQVERNCSDLERCVREWMVP